jgi:hypothetical protein
MFDTCLIELRQTGVGHGVNGEGQGRHPVPEKAWHIFSLHLAPGI